MRPHLHRQRHDPTKSLVGFVVGDVHYAVPIACVREICNPMTLVAMPRAPAAVIGVADYRGDVVPVVDVRARFGLPPLSQTRRTKWILVGVREHFLALVVDAVTEVFGTGGQDLRPVPALGGGDDVRGIAGVTSHADTLTFVLDTRKLGELTEPLITSGALKSSIPPAAPSLPPSSASMAPPVLITRKPVST